MSDWLSVLVAGMGISGTLASAIVTQRRADRREDRRSASDEKRAQVAMTREDAARSYEHRRAAYVDFIMEYRARYDVLVKVRDASTKVAGADPEILPHYLDQLRRLIVPIQVFGTHAAATYAQNATELLWSYVFQPDRYPGINPNTELQVFIAEVRADLDVRDRVHPLPGHD